MHALEEAGCDDIKPSDWLLLLGHRTLRDIDVGRVPIVEHWKRERACCRRHAGKRPYAIQQFRYETAFCVVIVAGLRNVELSRQDPMRVEPKIRAGQAIEAAQQQRRADEQYHAQRSLRDDERGSYATLFRTSPALLHHC